MNTRKIDENKITFLLQIGNEIGTLPSFKNEKDPRPKKWFTTILLPHLLKLLEKSDGSRVYCQAMLEKIPDEIRFMKDKSQKEKLELDTFIEHIIMMVKDPSITVSDVKEVINTTMDYLKEGKPISFTPISIINGDKIDIRHGKFPEDNKFVIFQAIQDLRDGKKSLNDLHSAIQVNRARLNITANLENIEGADVVSGTHIYNRTFRAEEISPLQYAFFTGRVDALALLLAEGVIADNSFFFQCTSMHAIPNEQSKITCTLYDLISQPYNHDLAINNMLTSDVTFAFIIALIQRGDENGIQILTQNIQVKCAECAKAVRIFNDLHPLAPLSKQHSFPALDEHDAKYLLSWIPPINKLKEQLGTMPSTHFSYLLKLISHLLKVTNDIKAGYGDYVVINENLRNILLQSLNELSHCFEEIACKASFLLHADAYQQQVIKRILLDFNKSTNFGNAACGFYSRSTRDGDISKDTKLTNVCR